MEPMELKIAPLRGKGVAVLEGPDNLALMAGIWQFMPRTVPFTKTAMRRGFQAAAAMPMIAPLSACCAAGYLHSDWTTGHELRCFSCRKTAVHPDALNVFPLRNHGSLLSGQPALEALLDLYLADPLESVLRAAALYEGLDQFFALIECGKRTSEAINIMPHIVI